MLTSAVLGEQSTVVSAASIKLLAPSIATASIYSGPALEMRRVLSETAEDDGSFGWGPRTRSCVSVADSTPLERVSKPPKLVISGHRFGGLALLLPGWSTLVRNPVGTAPPGGIGTVDDHPAVRLGVSTLLTARDPVTLRLSVARPPTAQNGWTAFGYSIAMCVVVRRPRLGVPESLADADIASCQRVSSA